MTRTPHLIAGQHESVEDEPALHRSPEKDGGGLELAATAQEGTRVHPRRAKRALGDRRARYRELCVSQDR